jgi:ribosomal protein S18 acetylase RimI-like enzyme
MAVPTSSAGGPALPAWARTRRGTDPTAVHLTVVEPGAVTTEATRRCCAQLAAAGYRRAVTNAMDPADAEVLLAAGVSVGERLQLLGRTLDDCPRPGRRVRRARGLAAIVRLDRAAFGARAFDVPALRDALDATPRARLRVAGNPARPVGYAVTGVAGRRAYVQRLAVDPTARRRGVGRTLLLDGLRWARRRGAGTAVVNTHDDNVGARALYRSVEFSDLPHGLVVLERAL